MKKIFLTTFVLIVLYELFLRLFSLGVSAGQSQANQNLIIAEDFLFEKNNLESSIVLIGSSLSRKLVNDLLPKNLYNLSFSGGTIHDGLSLLNSSQTFPDYVLIEMNRPIHKENREFITSLVSPISNFKKSHLKLFLTKNQPVQVFKNVLMTHLQKENLVKKKKPRNRRKEKIKEQIIQFRIDNLPYLETLKLLPQEFFKLKEEINKLEKNGVQIILYYPPIEKKLCDLPVALLIKSKWFKHFPKTKYSYIDQPDCSEYNTTDGIHLTHNSAIMYTNYFTDNLLRIMKHKN